MSKFRFIVLAAMLCLSCASPPPIPSTPHILEAKERAELILVLCEQAVDAFGREVDRLADAGMLKPDDTKRLADDEAQVRAVLDKIREGQQLAEGEARKALDTASAGVALARALGAKLSPVTDQAIGLARDLVGE